MLSRTIGLSTLLCLLASTGAWSAVIISNPSVDDNARTYFPGTIFPTQNAIKGLGFTMGATSFTLESLDLRLCFSNLPGGCSVPDLDGSVGTPVVRLFSDAGGNPSAELFTFVNPVFALGTADYTFLPPGPFVLTAGTSYWIVVHSPDGAAFTWLANNPFTAPAGNFATHLGERVSGDAPTPPTGPSPFANIYTLNGTAVPEPSSTLLVSVSLAGWLIARRYLSV
jgi:hypothetical protein